MEVLPPADQFAAAGWVPLPRPAPSGRAPPEHLYVIRNEELVHSLPGRRGMELIQIIRRYKQKAMNVQGERNEGGRL